ncbi:hypothetical protein WMY93_033900 [Mugilogobius chulae]|uniref:Uncharacterized protein n=1 Tax=Mugilogobius chulae TaxID=88201 RepID=A0AAW0MGS3_9GOBI
MGVRSLGCVAHSCQLCVQEGLLSQRSVTEILANARKIVGHFKHSPLAYSRLEDIQMDLHMDIKRLQQDVQSANLLLAKEHLIQEVAKSEGMRVASAVPEETGAAAEPVNKAPRHEGCSSLDSAFEEILQERQSQARSVSTTSAEAQANGSLIEIVPHTSGEHHTCCTHNGALGESALEANRGITKTARLD